MQKYLTIIFIFLSMRLFAYPECGGFCDKGVMPTIEIKSGYMIYTDIPKPIHEQKENFLKNLVKFEIIESVDDVVLWTEELIILKAKKKLPDGLLHKRKKASTKEIDLKAKEPTVVINVHISQG